MEEAYSKLLKIDVVTNIQNKAYCRILVLKDVCHRKIEYINNCIGSAGVLLNGEPIKNALDPYQSSTTHCGMLVP